ncbi:3-phosphoshikimate 1-carboxyvinyltransferase [Candidatus Tachikawaea gelatinosa]|uniref:3-phosphoshikimate 1-carboxyvinyltransferase n=1 Tax=Candidatus Tachikawaea gelatinosa TaxID=1410383 RepID=A0A090BWF3_9ENTR|nr:3-phosphoshikimate 1-carboxyvinyltransferase [Candidatus Tachikawaea gelatinosa]BAP58506.1 3-phosphoshikimate 1-carboxyvinyltransferase [Candidatus Tachikawaea gelatinosa]
MHESLTLKPIDYVNGNINLPGSKSISNRVLLLSSIANGKTNIENLLKSDDVEHMLNALKILDVKYEFSENLNICKMFGQGKKINPKSNNLITLFLGNAGTAMRSLTAMLSLANKNILLTCEQRMTERPIFHLVDALTQGGAKIDYVGKKNYPPLLIKGGFTGGDIQLNGNLSSQFLSALLMMAPLAKKNTTIYIKNELVSKPYIDITLNLIKYFGITIQHDSYKKFIILGNQQYISPKNYLIEGDATSASYFLAAGAIKGGIVKVSGINKNSLQGDIFFADVLAKMGANIYWGKNNITCKRNGQLRAINMDVNHIPDAAMTLAIVAVFAKGTTILKNIYNWRIKETDRLKAMTTELRKIGACIEEGQNYLIITPPKKFHHAKINTYNDHRMAMCFSLIALSNKSVTIVNPKCVSKTFPNFFRVFKEISYTT